MKKENQAIVLNVSEDCIAPGSKQVLDWPGVERFLL